MSCADRVLLARQEIVHSPGGRRMKGGALDGPPNSSEQFWRSGRSVSRNLWNSRRNKAILLETTHALSLQLWLILLGVGVQIQASICQDFGAGDPMPRSYLSLCQKHKGASDIHQAQQLNKISSSLPGQSSTKPGRESELGMQQKPPMYADHQETYILQKAQ